MAQNDDDVIDAGRSMIAQTWGQYKVAPSLPLHAPGLGFVDSMVADFRSSALQTAQRWASLADSKEDEVPLSPKQFETARQGRPLEYFEGITGGETARQVAAYDHEKWLAGYQRNGLGSLVGGIVPSLFDPANVAGMFLGGPLGEAGGAALTRGSTTLAAKLVRTGVSIGAVGEASVPFEALAEQQQTGKVSPEQVAGTVLSPLEPQTWALAALHAGVSRAFAGRTKAPVAAQDIADSALFDPADLARHGAQATQNLTDAPAAPAPPESAPIRIPIPKARMHELFSEYPGGVGSFLRDASDGTDSAKAHAMKHGFPLDSEPMQNFLRDAAVTTAQTLVRPPAELQQLLTDARNLGSAESANRLKAAGMLDDKGALRTEFQPLQGKTSVAEVPQPAPSLPEALAGAKPRFNVGKTAFTPQFDSDVDKALFIASQKTKSKADASYRDFLRGVGLTDAQIDAGGAQVRDEIKTRAAAQGKGGALAIPRVADLPRKKASVRSFDTNAQSEFLRIGPEGVRLRAARVSRRISVPGFGDAELNQDYHVGLAGASSKDGTRVYASKEIDLQKTIRGKTYDFGVPLGIHELTERKAELEGHSYADAHYNFAEPAEDAWVRANWPEIASEYESHWKDDIKRAALGVGKPGAQEPPDAIKKPYEHPHGVEARRLLAAINAGEKAPAPTPSAELPTTVGQASVSRLSNAIDEARAMHADANARIEDRTPDAQAFDAALQQDPEVAKAEEFAHNAGIDTTEIRGFLQKVRQDMQKCLA